MSDDCFPNSKHSGLGSLSATSRASTGKGSWILTGNKSCNVCVRVCASVCKCVSVCVWVCESAQCLLR